MLTGTEWKENYEYWHPSALINEHGYYRIVNNGVLTKKDCSLLFETGENRLFLPAETVGHLGFFDDVSLGSGTLKLLAEKEIACSFYDQYGRLIGRFIPEKAETSLELLIEQACNYKNKNKRTLQAKEIEKTIVYHLGKMAKTFTAKSGKDITKQLTIIEESEDKIYKAKTIKELLLIEARGRQVYFGIY